eukprot:1293817-Amphidinium_carterae.1
MHEARTESAEFGSELITATSNGPYSMSHSSWSIRYTFQGRDIQRLHLRSSGSIDIISREHLLPANEEGQSHNR